VKISVLFNKIPTDCTINPLNTKLNPICHLLALLGAHHIFHVSGLRVKNMFIKDAMCFGRLKVSSFVII